MRLRQRLRSGFNVDDRHLMLVADAMIYWFIKGTNRYGITKTKASVLARASFELLSVTYLRRRLLEKWIINQYC
jgi:hypothetical protein